MTLVFVYGTLKRGGGNHHFLAGQAFVDEARTARGYTLYDLSGYPGMVRQDDDDTGVMGEVWSVDDECLARLDVLECTAEGLYLSLIHIWTAARSIPCMKSCQR